MWWKTDLRRYHRPSIGKNRLDLPVFAKFNGAAGQVILSAIHQDAIRRITSCIHGGIHTGQCLVELSAIGYMTLGRQRCLHGTGREINGPVVAHAPPVEWSQLCIISSIWCGVSKRIPPQASRSQTRCDRLRSTAILRIIFRAQSWLTQWRHSGDVRQTPRN